MARGGPRPNAGHPKGPRQSTIDRALRAELAVVDARVNGKKLAKDVLQDFMELFSGMAATYQPLPPGAVLAPNDRRAPDEEKFLRYAKLAVDTAAELLPTQTPTLRAVMVSTPGQPINADQPGDRAKLVNVLDANAVSREYQRLIKGPAPAVKP